MVVEILIYTWYSDDICSKMLVVWETDQRRACYEELAGEELAGGELAGGELAGEELAGEELADEELAGGVYSLYI